MLRGGEQEPRAALARGRRPGDPDQIPGARAAPWRSGPRPRRLRAFSRIRTPRSTFGRDVQPWTRPGTSGRDPSDLDEALGAGASHQARGPLPPTLHATSETRTTSPARGHATPRTRTASPARGRNPEDTDRFPGAWTRGRAARPLPLRVDAPQRRWTAAPARARNAREMDSAAPRARLPPKVGDPRRKWTKSSAPGARPRDPRRRRDGARRKNRPVHEPNHFLASISF